MLLGRHALGPVAAVTRLVGLQAQEPGDPYVALHARLARFDPRALSRAIAGRELVRIVVMRGTVHLVTAADAATLRPLMQPVLDAELTRHPDVRAARPRDMRAVVAAARGLLSDPQAPRSMRALRAELEARFPGEGAPGLAYACRNLLPLVQAPPRGLWQRGGQVAHVTLEAWTGRGLDPAPSLDEAVLRYLAAFGPALPADVAAWSRLTGMREVLERLRPRLVIHRDERGRELFDIPAGPLPDPDTPAPPRLLPEYDNALLSHGDRTRFHGPGHQELTEAVGESWGRCGAALLDGTILGPWHLDRQGEVTTLVIRHLRSVTRRAEAPLTTEARRVLRLLAPDAPRHEVRLERITA